MITNSKHKNKQTYLCFKYSNNTTVNQEFPEMI